MNFIAKQALGGVTKDLTSLAGEKKEVDPEEEKRRQEHQEALLEQENERKAKHAKFEAGREATRNKIRNKHNLRTAEQKAEAEKAAADPMAAAMAAPVPDSLKKPEYDDTPMGQAQEAFDNAKQKAEEIQGQAMEQYNNYAPDQCKQQWFDVLANKFSVFILMNE